MGVLLEAVTHLVKQGQPYVVASRHLTGVQVALVVADALLLDVLLDQGIGLFQRDLGVGFWDEVIEVHELGEL